MGLVILRCVFLMVAAGLATLFVNQDVVEVRYPRTVFVGVMLVAGVVLITCVIFVLVLQGVM